MRLPQRSLVLLLVGLLAACSGGPIYQQRDGAPSRVPSQLPPDPEPEHLALSKYGNPKSYTVMGKTYRLLPTRFNYSEQGIASWYGTKFHGRRTSSGEPFDMYAMTAAHKTLPIPVFAKVTNLDNGKSIIVKINDRGPFLHNRIIDLSYAAAIKLDIHKAGTAPVEVTTIDPRDWQPDTIQQPAVQYAAKEPATTVIPPPPEKPLNTTDTQEHATMYVQVAAFGNFPTADRARLRLKQATISNVVIEQTTLTDTPLFRVKIGPFRHIDDVDRITEKVAELGFIEPRIIVQNTSPVSDGSATTKPLRR